MRNYAIDGRGYALDCAAFGVPLDRLKYPVTPVEIRRTWVYTARSNCPSFHLPGRAFAAWLDGYPPYFLVTTHCGRKLNDFESSMAPPADKELCDDCAFADMHRPAVYRFFDMFGRLLYITSATACSC